MVCFFYFVVNISKFKRIHLSIEQNPKNEKILSCVVLFSLFANSFQIQNREKKIEVFMRTCDLWKEINLLICPWMWNVFCDQNPLSCAIWKEQKSVRTYSRSIWTYHYRKIHSECLRKSLSFSPSDTMNESIWYLLRKCDSFIEAMWQINSSLALTTHLFGIRKTHTHTFLFRMNRTSSILYESRFGIVKTIYKETECELKNQIIQYFWFQFVNEFFYVFV